MKTDKDMVVPAKDDDKNLALPRVSGGLGIRGLEEEDASLLPIPFVRVVQGQSKDTKTKDGKDAPEGHFFFNDTRESMEKLTFCILKSKVVVTEFERDGIKKPTTQRKILGITIDTKKLFILTVSVTSFANYGRLIAEMKQNKVVNVWDRMVTATTERQENDKGKFFVINFALAEELSADDIIDLGLEFEQHKKVLEKKEEDEESTSKEKVPFK